MKRAARLCISLTLCLLAWACSPKTPPTAVIETHASYTKCVAPAKPVFAKLPEDGQHIGSKDVMDKLTKNIVEWELYSNSTDGTLRCYEAQAKE